MSALSINFYVAKNNSKYFKFKTWTFIQTSSSHRHQCSLKMATTMQPSESIWSITPQIKWNVGPQKYKLIDYVNIQILSTIIL